MSVLANSPVNLNLLGAAGMQRTGGSSLNLPAAGKDIRWTPNVRQEPPSGLGVSLGRTLGQPTTFTPNPNWDTTNPFAVLRNQIGLSPGSIDRGALNAMNANSFLGGLGLINQANTAYDRVASNNAAQQLHIGNLGNFARQEYNLGLQGVGLDRELLGIERGSLVGDTNDINAGFGVAKGKHDVRIAGLLADAAQLRDIEKRKQGLDQEALAELAYQEERQQRQLMGQMGAAGAIGGQGFIEAGRDIAAGAKQQRSDIAEGAAQRNDKLQKELRDIDQNKSLLNWDLWQAGLDRNTQLRKIDERQKTLDVQAKKLNLTAQQLSLALNKQLEQLNLQRVISQGQLLDAMNSRDAAVQSAAFQVMNQIQLNNANAPRRQ